ncbi:MAG: nucleoside hydrolase [Acidobacteria bacterium]|nr:nucleoside hydrolase [Acidobacteriota bacterium]
MRFLLPFLAALSLGAAPARIIFDTDMGNDVDDALALALLHALESRGEAKILAVTVTKDHPDAAVFCDILNHYYGRPGIPIGMVKGGKTPKPNPMITAPVGRRKPDGQPLYPRRLRSGNEAPDATQVLRRVLAAEADGSVTIVQVGFSTNLARLLDSKADAISPLAGRELAARKVKLLSVMAGQFPTGPAEYNVREDVESAAKVFGEWPGPVVFSGFEIGLALLFPGASIEQEFGYSANHPVADSYRAYMKMPYDRPTWDLTAALFGVRPGHQYFTLSAPGSVQVNSTGVTSFRAHPDGRHRYFLLEPGQRARTLEALTLLSSEPPRAPNR